MVTVRCAAVGPECLRTPSNTTDANLDCAFVEHSLVFIDQTPLSPSDKYTVSWKSKCKMVLVTRSVIEQVDEFLHSINKPKIFSKKFEGIFSDQKICEGCPHRYEREQTFMALNLTVKSSNLQESLDQFVKGELLEGDNAYFCEKCQEKRNTIKRMCIRKLPQTLVIQLKRFHYDWETNRAVKFDDYFQVSMQLLI